MTTDTATRSAAGCQLKNARLQQRDRNSNQWVTVMWLTQKTAIDFLARTKDDPANVRVVDAAGRVWTRTKSGRLKATGGAPPRGSGQ